MLEHMIKALDAVYKSLDKEASNEQQEATAAKQ